MYSIPAYGTMIADNVRMSAYTRALEETITPGCTVMDLGSGPGILAMLACQMGAGHVYAVEPDDSIQLARDLAAANGFSDRIECIPRLSTEITLARPADVIIADLRGVLPAFQRNIQSIIDARSRHLAVDGTLIPQRDLLRATIVEAPSQYAEIVEPWDDRTRQLDLGKARALVTNMWYKKRIPATQFLADPETWSVIDYETVEDPTVSGRASWRASRTGVLHGLSVWFDSLLIGDIGFSCSPAAPELIYGSAFFPLLEPVPVEEGDAVDVSLQARFTDQDYVWFWSTKVSAAGSDLVRADFKQSTFFGAPLSADQVRKRRDDYVPSLSREGEIERAILARMDGSSTLGQIAREVRLQFPSQFPSWENALARVADTSSHYTG